MGGILRKEVSGLVERKSFCAEHSPDSGICVKCEVRTFAKEAGFLLWPNLLYVLVVSFVVYFIFTLFRWIQDFVWTLISKFT